MFSCCYDGELQLQAEEDESVSLMTLEDILQHETSDDFASDSLASVLYYAQQIIKKRVIV